MKAYFKNQYRVFVWIIIIMSFLEMRGYCQTNSSDKEQKKKKDWSKIYDKAKNSVVLIDYPDGSREVGSGVVVGVGKNGRAYILTAYHVVEGFDEVVIKYKGNTTIRDIGIVNKGKSNETDDVALVEVDNPSFELKAINFTKKVPKIGSLVGTIGHPAGDPFSWTDGSIKNMSGKYIFHNAELQVGNSGGPLLDHCAHMGGMNVHVMYRVVIERDSLDEKQETNIILEEGTSVTLNSSTIIPYLETWLGETSLKDKWKVRRYCSFWQNPGFYIPVAAVTGTVIYLLTTSPSPDKFGEPPGPPSN